MDWKTLLAYITGTVDQELLLCNEYLATENGILRNQMKGRLRLSDGERKEASRNKVSISNVRWMFRSAVSMRKNHVVPVAMELGSFELQGGHLGIADFDPRWRLAGVQSRLDPQSLGLPRQLAVMWQHRRCSILCHWLVPGGRWLTPTRRPLSSAKRYNARFHRRARALLLPPLSAVISSALAGGYMAAPS
jgi:hypothetical protein